MSMFKAYDIRGVYPTQLNEESALKIGKSFFDSYGRDYDASKVTGFSADFKAMLKTPVFMMAPHKMFPGGGSGESGKTTREQFEDYITQKTMGLQDNQKLVQGKMGEFNRLMNKSGFDKRSQWPKEHQEQH